MGADLIDRNEIEIDLVDMLSFLLKKWKKIALVTILGMLLATGYLLANNMNAPQREEVLKAKIEAATEELTADQIALVDNTYDQYKTIRQKKYQVMDESKHSLLNKMDYKNVHQMAAYYVSSSDIANIGNYYTWNLLSDADKAKIVEILGGESQVDIAHVNELISVYSSTDDHEYILQNDTKGEYPAVMLGVSVIGKDENTCRQVLDVIEAALQRKTDQLIENGYAVATKQIDESYTVGQNGTVQNYQVNLTNTLRDYDEQLAKLASPDVLSSSEKEYYNILTNRAEIVEKVHVKRTIAIGGFLGLILMAGIYIFRYVFDTRIKTITEIQDRYKIPVVASLDARKSKKKFSDRIKHAPAYPVEYGEKLIKEEIKYYTRDKKSVYIAGITCGEQTRMQLSSLFADTNLVRVGDPSMQADELETMLQSSYVMVVATIGKTKHESVQRILNMCRHRGIQSACINVLED